MNVMRYVQGDWFAVIVDQLIVMLSPQTAPALIDQVWDAAHSGASLEEHLSLVIAGGLAPTFALVHVDQGRLRGYLRGDITLEVVGGTVEPPVGGAGSGDAEQLLAPQADAGARTQFTAGPAVPWLGVAIRDMSEVWLAVPATATQNAVLPVSAGVVRATQVGFLTATVAHSFDETLFGPTILGVPSHVRTELGEYRAGGADIDELFGETILEVSARVRTAPGDQAGDASREGGVLEGTTTASVPTPSTMGLANTASTASLSPTAASQVPSSTTSASTVPGDAPDSDGAETGVVISLGTRTASAASTGSTPSTGVAREHNAEDDELFGETILEISARVRTGQETQTPIAHGDHADRGDLADRADHADLAAAPSDLDEPSPDDDELFGQTVVDVPAFARAKSGEAPEDDELFGHTIIDPNAIARLRASRPAAQTSPPSTVTSPPPLAPSPRAPAVAQPRPVQASAVMASDADHDGDTVMSSDLVEIRAQLPTWSKDAVPGPFRVPDKVAPPKLMLSTGVVVTLDRTVLIGRSPAASRVSNRNLPRLVTVESPNHDISRTHVQVQAEGHRVFVTDLNSTNGVTLSPRGRAPETLRPGVPTDLAPDATVDIGDGVTFRVVRN